MSTESPHNDAKMHAHGPIVILLSVTTPKKMNSVLHRTEVPEDILTPCFSSGFVLF